MEEDIEYKQNVNLKYYLRNKLIREIDDIFTYDQMTVSKYCFDHGIVYYDYLLIDNGRVIIFPCKMPILDFKRRKVTTSASDIFYLFSIKDVNKYRKIRDAIKVDGKTMSFYDVKDLGYDFQVIDTKNLKLEEIVW